MRILRRTGLVLFVILLGAFVFAYAYLRSTLPPTSGTVTVAGPSAPIEIDFDTLGIPQVWAQTETDAYFALGWLHAADRLFQMELLRRSADGRLSELFGEVTLPADIAARRIGHRRMAHAALGQLAPDDRARLEAYAAGVNAYVAQATLPFEFRLLGARFAPWTVEDTLAVASFQAWYSDDLTNADEWVVKQIAGGMSVERAKSLLPGPDTPAPATAPAASVGEAVARWMLPDRAAADDLLGSLTLARASNAWALAPSKSGTSHAVLADDPHTQGPDLPGLWYIAGLHATDTGLDAVGATAPGVPGIVMGHSRAAAWGMTASGVDLHDHYVEKVDPSDPGRYLTPDGWKPFDVRHETIRVRGRAEPAALDVRWTRHGPVVYEEPTKHEVIAWRWAGFDFSPAADAASLLALPHVTDWDGFWGAVGGTSAGAFNWVFASAKGQIAYGMGSPVPIRTWSDTVLPVDGSTDAHEWQGYYPPDRKPHVVDPPEGWVANANNAPDTSGLGYTLGGLGFDGDRMLRIRQLMHPKNKDRLDINDMIAMQLDRVDAAALRFRDDAVRVLMPLNSRTASQLKSWDGSMTPDSTEAAVFNVWLADLNRDIFGDQLGGPVRRVFFEAVLARPESPWYDDVRTPQVETREDMLERAMKEAYAEVGGRQWGKLAHVTLEHPMARVPVVGWLLRLRRGPYEWGGSPGTINASIYARDPAGGFVQRVGPAFRQIVDFTDVDGALMALTAGESGNPISPHFFDFWPVWRTGTYWKVPLTRARVRDRLSSTLVLRPAAR
jgi:penicillin amidase